MRLARRGRSDLGTALRASDRWWLAGVVLAGGILAPPLLLWVSRARPRHRSPCCSIPRSSSPGSSQPPCFASTVGTRILAATGLVGSGWNRRRVERGGPAISPAAAATLAACVLWGLDNNFTRRIAEADPLALVEVKGLAAGATNLILAGLVGSPQPHLSAVALGLGLGAVSYGASLVLFVLALRGLGAARAGAYSALAPFFGAAGAVLVLGEPLTPRLAVAGALMAAAVWLLAREAHGHWHEHAPGVHEHRHVHDAHHQHAHQGWEGPEPRCPIHTQLGPSPMPIRIVRIFTMAMTTGWTNLRHDPAELAGEPLLLRERGSATRHVIERAFADGGVPTAGSWCCPT